MKYFFTLLLLVYAIPVIAHVPFVVTQTSLDDLTYIEDPELSRAFYGTLTDFPHTYEIRATEAFHLYAEILVPDTAESRNTVSGIIVEVLEGDAGVVEVARMPAQKATWESFYEVWGGDSYRKGSLFEQDMEPGVYRIEVSTPDNREKYVLAVGKREESGGLGYFETVRRIADVKEFFGKSKFWVIESLLVYVPLIVLSLFGGGVWYWWRCRKGARDRSSLYE